MIGNTLSHYKIISKLGQGGMGEVYLAQDSRLDRKVALKILPEHLSERADLRERFEREARAVSSLNHPHICTLYDIGEQDGIHYLVMEHLEGESLADRLEKGALPLEQTLEYAIQIADALDKAHRQGVVHRDLKPGNIMLVKSGAKLLDFGLAKLKATEATEENLSTLPTEQTNLTVEGTILGTLQYMPPEQLEGQETDSRTDIFAFGAVVYEMVTGKKAFEGQSQASLIGAILKDDPPSMSELQPKMPAILDRVIKRCLAKDPDERWQTAHDLASELKWINEGGGQTSGAAVPPSRQQRRPWILATALLVVAVIALAVPYLLNPSSDSAAVRLLVETPDNLQGSFPAMMVSPDGLQLAFTADTAEGVHVLWVRPLDSLAPRALPGTNGAFQPFWSPDSRSIGFFAGGKLKRVALSGGLPETVTDTGLRSRGGAWSQDGTIIFGHDNGEIYRVPAGVGTATPITTLDPSLQENSHRWPHFMPDGRHFLCLSRSGDPENNGIYLESLDSSDRTRVVSALSRVEYVPPGYLLFWREGALVAQPFDVNRMETSGDPFPVVGQVWYGLATAWAAFSASRDVISYIAGSRPAAQTVWLDRNGGPIESSAKIRGNYGRLSPDENRVAVVRIDPEVGTNDVWVHDLSRGIDTRLTFHPTYDENPVWSPDGTRIVFSAQREGPPNLFVKLLDGSEEAQQLLASESIARPGDWSADGNYIVYHTEGVNSLVDLWVLPLDGGQKPFPFLQTEFNETQGRLSPDGRWMAYSSDESGRSEVYVQDFPGSQTKWRISSEGGGEPQWRQDGKELFYIDLESTLMAVPLKSASTFEAGLPQALFQAPFAFSSAALWHRNFYSATSDGQRFLAYLEEPSQQLSAVVVLNWTAELQP